MKKENRGKRDSDLIRGFKVVEDECIWMKAGVVNFRMCDNVFDCSTCPFDTAMQKAMNAGKRNPPESPQKRDSSRWVSGMKHKYKEAQVPCRHVLTGRIDAPKICVHNYECHSCQYDQWLDDAEQVDVLKKAEYQNVSGYNIADDYYYHEGHTWARFEHGGRVRVGVDDFFVRLFGPEGGFELPALGDSLKQGQSGMVFLREEGEKASLLSPVSGTVVAINPNISSEDPYNEGWLLLVETKMPKLNHKKLIYGPDAIRWVEDENRKLLGMLGPQYEKMAATGGRVINNIYGQFPELDWQELTKTFLKT